MFNREKKTTAPDLTTTLKDLVGTGQNGILADTRGSQFLAQAMSSKQNSSIELESIKADLIKKAELFAELSSICSKSAMALGDAIAFVGWENQGTSSDTIWKQMTDFLDFLKDKKLANIS